MFEFETLFNLHLSYTTNRNFEQIGMKQLKYEFIEKYFIFNNE